MGVRSFHNQKKNMASKSKIIVARISVTIHVRNPKKWKKHEDSEGNCVVAMTIILNLTHVTSSLGQVPFLQASLALTPSGPPPLSQLKQNVFSPK